MLFLIVLTVVAVVVAVGALQNGQSVTVTFFFWQFEASLALVILASTAGGLVIGALVNGTQALRRWRHRSAGQAAPDVDASGRDRSRPSAASSGTRIQR